MNPAISQFIKNKKNLIHRQPTNSVAYAVMYLNDCEANQEDTLAVFLSEAHYPEIKRNPANAAEEQALITCDEFGLIWRDLSSKPVRIGTPSEPLSEDVIEAARSGGVLVFFINEVSLTPVFSTVFCAAQAH